MRAMRRNVIFCVAAIVSFALTTAVAWAVTPSVEIVAMAHPPVQSVLRDFRGWLAQQGDKIRVIEIDAESPQGKARLESIGLKGHIPIVILVNGKTHYRNVHGADVEFVGFPAVKESPPGVRGNWQIEDVQAMLLAQLRKRNSIPHAKQRGEEIREEKAKPHTELEGGWLKSRTPGATDSESCW